LLVVRPKEGLGCADWRRLWLLHAEQAAALDIVANRVGSKQGDAGERGDGFKGTVLGREAMNALEKLTSSTAWGTLHLRAQCPLLLSVRF
jgi:hypothetical protein